jgi:16S rRNA processing protein RimM
VNRTPEDLLLVGRVAKAHGVRGELKAIPETDDPARLRGLREVFVGPSADAARPFAVEALRTAPHPKGTTLLVKLAGIASPEAADALRGQGLYAPASRLPPLEEDEFFLHDLVGLAVETTDGVPRGTVTSVMDGPAHRVLVVRGADGAETLVPDVPAFVASVDVAARRLVLHPVEGLFGDAEEA